MGGDREPDAHISGNPDSQTDYHAPSDEHSFPNHHPAAVANPTTQANTHAPAWRATSIPHPNPEPDRNPGSHQGGSAAAITASQAWTSEPVT